MLSARLSFRQAQVLELMQKGWELGFDASGWGTFCCIQQGGVGSGGAFARVHQSTLFSLRERGYIERAPKKPNDGMLERYQLTERGKAVGKEQELLYGLMCLDCKHLFAVRHADIKTAKCEKCGSDNTGSSGSCNP